MTERNEDEKVASLVELLGLKDELRTGWELRGIEEPEDVAAHSWGVALLCLLFADEARVDAEQACAMAVVHDLAEARTGDVPTRAGDAKAMVANGNGEKEARERAALEGLLGPFEAVGIRERWEAYEARESAVARFVKDMDLVDMCVQAVVYEREDRYDGVEANEHFTEYEDLDEFFTTAAARVRTPVGEALFERALAAYESEVGRDCRL